MFIYLLENRQNFWYIIVPWNDWYQYPLTYIYWFSLLWINSNCLFSKLRFTYGNYIIFAVYIRLVPTFRNLFQFNSLLFCRFLVWLLQRMYTYLPVLSSRYGSVWEYGEQQEVFRMSWRPMHQSKQLIVPFGYPPEISKQLVYLYLFLMFTKANLVFI